MENKKVKEWIKAYKEGKLSMEELEDLLKGEENLGGKSSSKIDWNEVARKAEEQIWKNKK